MQSDASPAYPCARDTHRENAPCLPRLLILVRIGAILSPRTVICIALAPTTSRGCTRQPEEQAKGQHAGKQKRKHAANDRGVGDCDEQDDVDPGDGNDVHDFGIIFMGEPKFTLRPHLAGQEKG